MYDTILVPLDGSKRAEAVLPHVRTMAARFDARVVLLVVEEPPAMLDVDEVIELENYLRERQSKRQALELYLKGVLAELENKGVRGAARRVPGPVVQTILACAEQEKADLVAMASHGWGGWPHTFYGSVSAGVLNRIDRPLLLVRSVDGP